MSWTLDDIIVAVASPPGPGVRGIVRVAGPGVQSLLSDSFRCESAMPWSESRRATRFEGRVAVNGLSIDLPCSFWFWPNQRSYAGQPTIEIHTVGSPPILDAIVQTFVERGARVARPGEFTLRAFMAGKIDLVQAEAVLGVIDADSTDRLQQALTQLSGGVSSRIRDLRESLLIDLADLEAGLDFVDEDIEFVQRSAMIARLENGLAWIAKLRRHAADRGQTTGRKRVVLAGLPNAGKSTLFNALVGKDAAVVSAIAGTTRDWLSAIWDLGGTSVDLIDTAGIEEVQDEISAAAQSGSTAQSREADLTLWCTPADVGPAVPAVTADENAILYVMTKCELAPSVRQALQPDGPSGTTFSADSRQPERLSYVAVSALTGHGLDSLGTAVRERLETGDRERGELLSSTLARCQASLAAAEDALQRARDLATAGDGDELISLELRRGLDGLGEIAGVVYTDDLLDRIFSRFCIGK
jgi:tRNA modification GTPase